MTSQSALSRTAPSRLANLAASLGLFAGFVLLWWLASHYEWVNKVFLPTPPATLRSLQEGLLQGDLATFTVATVQRMALGWGLACLLGVALGALVGISATARSWVQPTLVFVRPLPASAIMPLAISISSCKLRPVLPARTRACATSETEISSATPEGETVVFTADFRLGRRWAYTTAAR